MPKNVDESLTDAPEVAADAESGPDVALAEKPAGVSPRDFGFAAWLSGVTPIRETVTIYADGHGQAEISRLSQLEATAPKGEREKIAEQLRGLYAHRLETGMDFVVEGRTSTWVKSLLDRAKLDGITDPIEVLLLQIAAQIVEPEGVTADHLRTMREAREAEVDRLFEAMTNVNRSKLGIDPRFLPAASG